MLAREYLMLLVAPVVLELVGLCFAVASDPYLSQRHRRMMFDRGAHCAEPGGLSAG